MTALSLIQKQQNKQKSLQTKLKLDLNIFGETGLTGHPGQTGVIKNILWWRNKRSVGNLYSSNKDHGVIPVINYLF